jgi:hypothetical protein
LVPDIIVFEGRIKNVYGGELYKLIEQGVTPKLLIEVKTSLAQVRWEEPSYVIEQIKEYVELLRPRNTALASLKTVNSTLKAQLKTLGVAMFENFAYKAMQEEFKRYVVKALMQSQNCLPLQYPQTIGELASLKDECIKRLKS